MVRSQVVVGVLRACRRCACKTLLFWPLPSGRSLVAVGVLADWRRSAGRYACASPRPSP